MTTKLACVCGAGLSLALVLLTGLDPALAAEERVGGRCSLGTLRGSYGLYRFGTGGFGGPLAAAGIATFDGAGNLSSVLNVSREGEISLEEEFNGTYTVSRNCTVEIVGEEGVTTDRSVIVDDGNGFFGVSVLDGVTVNTVGRRIKTIEPEDH